jgi:hypothetical protein
MPKNPARTIACQKGLEGWGGGGGGCQKRTLPCWRIFLIFADQIFQKVGGIKNHFGPFFCTLFAHPFKFAGCKIFPRKTKDFTAH